MKKSKKTGNGKKWKNQMALMLGAFLLAGSLSGCGQKNESAQHQDPAVGESGEEVQKGAYLETEVPMTGIPEDVTVKQLYTVDDKIRLVTAVEEGEGFKLQEWELQGDSFAEVTQPWLTEFVVPAETWADMKLMEDGNGIQYLFCNLLDDERDAYAGALWRSDGDGVKEITPEKWTTYDDQWGSYEYIQGIAALENGTLAVKSYTFADRISGEDGSVLDSQPVSDSYGEDMITDGKNVYVLSLGASATVSGMERWAGGSLKDATKIPFGQTSSYGVQFCALPDGTLYSADADGIFCCEPEAEDWKKLISGQETSFSLSGCWCTDLTALQDGRIYALFQEEGDVAKLLKYEYDPEAMPVVRTVLNLYAVEESTLLQNAAAMYHKAHPEVLIELQFAYNEEDKYSGETLDYSTVFQQVNTMLMGSEAPDILVMDHLDKDSFIQKGLLADVYDVVKPLEEDGTLLSNIMGAYLKEDGTQYVVPLQFGFNIALGRDISGMDMTSMQSLATFLNGKQESYMGPRTVTELVDQFYPYFCASIVKDKELDREALSEYLKSLKQIGDNCGIIEKRSSNERDADSRAYNKWDLAYRAKFAIEEDKGFLDSMYILAMADYIKGDFTAFENAFVPYIEMGISAQSEYQDVAKDFLAFCLSEEVQGRDYYSGYPVNALSLEMLGTQTDNSNLSAVTDIEVGDGMSEMFYIDPVSLEKAQELIKLCKGLDHPVKEDSKIREVLIENLLPYFQGNQSLEDTIDKIENGLRMYLAE